MSVKKISIISFFVIILILIGIKFYYSNTNLTSEEKNFLKRKGTIIFVSQTKYPPFEFVNKDYVQTGMVIELVKWISIELGFNTKFVHTSFYNAQQMILNNQADVLTSFFYSKERDKKFDFTKTVFYIPASIFVRIDYNKIKNNNDLNGKLIAIQKGDYAISFLKQNNIKYKLIKCKNFIEATDMLINGRVDAVVGDEQIILFYIQKKDLFSKIKIVGNPLYVGLDSMAVKEGNKMLLSILDKGITLAQKRGIIDSIQRKWLGSKYAQKTYTKYFYILFAILIFAIVIIILIWIWNQTLQNKIKERTLQLEKLYNRLQNSEKKFRGFFEKSLFPYILADRNKFIDCNIAAVNILKAPNKQALLGDINKISPIYQPDGILSNKKAYKIVNEVFKTGKVKTVEWILKTFEGETFYVLLTLSLVPYENRNAVLLTWIDISELKKLQKIIEMEKEELEVTLKSIGDGVIKIDITGKIELMNRIAEELTGWKLSDAKGLELKKIFKIYDTLTKKEQKNPADKVLETGEIETLSNNTILISRNGKEYHIADSAAPIRNKEGELIGIIVVFRDVTEKLEQEKELLKIEKLRSLGILAGGIAHDFNNLLTGLFGYISLAKEVLSEDNLAYKYIVKSENSLDKAIRLTHQLLTFSKGGEPVLEHVDIKTLIEEVVTFNLRGSNVQPIFDFEQKLFALRADKSQIGQVISNITINAKQAMNKGGKLYIKVRNSLNPLDLKGKFLKIEIRDEGIGIPKEIIDKIFDPYFTTKPDGNGLGLTTVYSIISKHNGKITVDSVRNKGSIFTIYLPAEDKKNNLTENILTPSRNSKSKINLKRKNKILFMDDDKNIIELAKDLFKFLGHKLEICSNGDEAIKKYKHAMELGEKFDLVILDLTIPGGKGGKETIKELLKFDPNVVAVVASGYSEDEIIANYKKYGFRGRLTKPYTLEKLKGIIAALIS